MGQGPARIRSKEKLTLNKWHKIVASRKGSRGELKINNEVSVKGQPQQARLTQLNVNKNLYFGALPTMTRG